MLTNKGNVFKLSKFTGLGNSLIQLSNAINVAKETESKLLMPLSTDDNWPEPFNYLRSIPDYNFGYTKESPTPEPYRTLVSKFYFDSQTFGHTLTNDKRRSILQEHVLPHLSLFKKEELSDTLVIHIRSGAIFNKTKKESALQPEIESWIHPNYVQPPLTYYKRIIEEESPQKILIVTEKNKANPCIESLLQWDNSIQVQTGTFTEDVNTMLSAEKLIVGFGTWGWALSLMSTSINKLWCPRICTDILDSNFENDPYIIKRYDFIDYIKMGDWKCTEEQKNIMIGDVNVVECE